MANLRASNVSGYTDYTGNVSRNFDDLVEANVSTQWLGDVFMSEFAEPLLEEKLELTLEVCVENTKQYIEDIDLIDTGDLQESIRYWEPRREGTELVGSYGVPFTYNGHDMDYGLYQEIGFRHSNGDWIHNEFLIHGLQRSRSEIRAIWQRGTTSIRTFDQV